MARTRYQNQAQAIPLRALPGAALRAVLREGYGAADFKCDIMAGCVVGVVALPLAMALAIAAGAPPQHGLYTAIVGGFVVAALGGSRTQVSGPTAAFVVILAPIYSQFGMAGLLVSGVMGGIMLVGMGAFRLGSMIEFIPHPVTTGFTAGIATVIATLQLKDFFGLTLAHAPAHFLERVAAMAQAWRTISPWEVIIGSATLVGLLRAPKLTKRVPAALMALPAAAIASLILAQIIPGFHVATIAERFHTVVDGHVIHGIPRLPPLPAWPWQAGGPDGQPFVLTFGTIRALLPGAFAVAMLGAVESLLSAVVADGLARTKHDPDAELLALGVGNILTPFFGGIPATGAIARTATNIRSGGRSPISAMVHALTVLAAVLVLAPLLGFVPMSALAALLLLVARNISEVKHFVHTIRVAPRSDVAVLLICYGLTVVFDMVIGVSVGMVLAAFLFMNRMAEVTQARWITEENHPDWPVPLPEGVSVYEISGPLFFGAAQKAMAALGQIADRSKAVILLMGEVHAMDVTGLVALESAVEQLHKQKCLAILSGVCEQPLALLTKANFDKREGVVVCAGAVAALAAAALHTGASHDATIPSGPPQGVH